MKNEFDKLNDVKNDLDNIEEAFISEEEKEKIRKRVMGKINKSKKKNKKKYILVASLLAVISSSFALGNENVLASIERMGKSIESFLDYKNESEPKYNYSSHKKEIIKEVEDKGIKLTLNEILLDNSEIYASVGVDYSNFNAEELGIKYDGDLGIIPNLSGKQGILVSENVIDFSNAGMSASYNEDGTTDVLFRIPTEYLLNENDRKTQKLDLGEKYNINLKINEMMVQIPKKEPILVEGDWSVDFELDTKKLAEEIKYFEPNNKIEFEYKDDIRVVTIDKITTSPISINIDYSYNSQVFEKGLDDEEVLELEFYDEKNNKLDFVSQGGGGDDNGMIHLSYKLLLESPDAIDVNKITIRPTIKKWNRFGSSTKFEGEYTNLK